jgi:predicted DNA-binding transcriptional regulator YafY
MVARDVKHLQTLGIAIEVSRTRPPIYTLRGGTPTFSDDDLRALALVRDSFGTRHPQSVQVAALLERLTAWLTERERQVYAQRPAAQAALEPAIDYTPYTELIARLWQAIDSRELLRLRYRIPRGDITDHRKVEPYDLEFYERHFYLVAYSHNSRQMHDFRVDRIASIESLMRLPPGHTRERRLITFRYRLAAEVARGGVSQRFEAQRVVETLPNGDVIVEAQGRSEFFIIQTLLRYRANAELLWPAELRRRMVAEVTRLAQLYKETAEGVEGVENGQQ